jgi:tetratricopeptide (TPR) repeat protein
MHISITLMRPLILALLIFNVACGGGPGGEFSPNSPTPNMRTQSQNTSDSNQKKPVKPKINRDAKQLFILAGQVANKPNPDYNRALDLYSEAYQKDKKLTIALYNAGLISELKGDETQARQFYEAAGSAGVGDGWVNLALMALNTGDKGQAESLFNRALSVEPLNGSAHLNLAMFAKERRDFEFAMKSVRNALKDDSTNANAYDVLAQIYYDLGRYKLALLVADAGLSELDSDHTGLWTTQGLIQLKMDDVIKAVRSFQKAVDLSPDNFAARLNLGLITFNYRDYDKSYQLLSEAVKLRPNSVEAIISHAVVARTLKRYDEARSGYNKVLELAPNHPGALFNIAVLDQDYVEVDPNDFDRRAQITHTAIDQYQRVINSTQSKTLRKKAQLRIEEAKVIIEAIDAEKESAAAEAEAAAQEANQPAPEAAPAQ